VHGNPLEVCPELKAQARLRIADTSAAAGNEAARRATDSSLDNAKAMKKAAA
jgi:hypothetical protein